MLDWVIIYSTYLLRPTYLVYIIFLDRYLSNFSGDFWKIWNFKKDILKLTDLYGSVTRCQTQALIEVSLLFGVYVYGHAQMFTQYLCTRGVPKWKTKYIICCNFDVFLETELFRNLTEFQKKNTFWSLTTKHPVPVKYLSH